MITILHHVWLVSHWCDVRQLLWEGKGREREMFTFVVEVKWWGMVTVPVFLIRHVNTVYQVRLTKHWWWYIGLCSGIKKLKCALQAFWKRVRSCYCIECSRNTPSVRKNKATRHLIWNVRHHRFTSYNWLASQPLLNYRDWRESNGLRCWNGVWKLAHLKI